MNRVREEAHDAVQSGAALIILSDRGVNQLFAPIPALLACSGVHQHLIREGTRTRCGIIIESGEPRGASAPPALLFGYGAGAVNPYLAFETLADLCRKEFLKNGSGDIDAKTAEKHYIKAINKGVLKVMSKMGISATAQLPRRWSLPKPSG